MSPPDPDRLLRDSAWLHRLARGLVRDDARAADAAQETLVAAIERPPPGGARRGWLRAVLANVLRQEGRGAARRAAREADAATSGTAAAASETAQRLALQRAVVDAVEALPEPLRTTVVLRYLDGHPPREVARRMDAPVKTVHSRLERALPRLRRRLDREVQGGRQGWLSALLPLAGGPVLHPWTPVGVLLMATKMKWAAGLVVAVIAGALSLGLIGALEPAAGVEPASTELRSTADRDRIDRTPDDIEASRAPAQVDSSAGSAVEAASVTGLLTGRVVNLEGQGVAGLRIDMTGRVQKDAQALISALDGTFRFPRPDARWLLEVVDEDWITIVRPVVDGESIPELPTIVVAPRRRYGGFVIDEAGTPLSGVRLRVMLAPGEQLAQLAGPDRWRASVGEAVSLEDGTFDLSGAAWNVGARVVGELAGYELVEQELPGIDATNLRLVMTPVPDRVIVSGVVVDAAGSPVAQAYVSFDVTITVQGAHVNRGPVATRTGPGGTFALELGERAGERVEVLAIAPGFQPARHVLERSDVDQVVKLVLDRPMSSMTGAVLDAGGDPVARASVWTWDSVPFGLVEHSRGGRAFTTLGTCEDLGAGAGPGREVETDESGRFLLGNLLDRDYVVHAKHPATQQIVTLAAIRAGGPAVTLRFERAEELTPIAGRVTSLGGEPLEGMSLYLAREVELPGGSSRLTSHGTPRATTDAEGRFSFPATCTRGTVVYLSDPRVPRFQRIDLDQAPDPTDLLFEVPATCWLRVVLEDPDRADQVRVLDGRGEVLNLVIESGALGLSGIGASLSAGRSDLIWIDERAVTLVLVKEGAEVERVPITPEAGEVLEVRR